MGGPKSQGQESGHKRQLPESKKKEELRTAASFHISTEPVTREEARDPVLPILGPLNARVAFCKKD